MPLDQIANLTDEQIAEICKEKDDEPEKSGEVVHSYQNLFYQTWSERGLSDEQIADKWRHDFPDQADEWHGP